jgi:hypothetical protein
MHDYGGGVARKSGAATRAQRGSCHRTPNFPPRHARHNLYAPTQREINLVVYAPAQREIMSKKRIPTFTRNALSSHAPLHQPRTSG